MYLFLLAHRTSVSLLTYFIRTPVCIKCARTSVLPEVRAQIISFRYFCIFSNSDCVSCTFREP